MNYSYTYTHIHSYVCVKNMLVFNSKDHNLAIEKDYEFQTSKRNVYYVSEL